MGAISVQAASEQLPELVDRAQGEAMFLERNNNVVAVLVSAKRYEQCMTALEDAEDIAAFDEAIAEDGPNIPWAQAKIDLGWDDISR
jgi:antitoxin Phd